MVEIDSSLGAVMTTFPGSPRVLKGALVSVDPVSLQPTVVPFQYNPATLTRSYEVGGGTGGPEAGQVRAPPAETIQLELELDATDDLEAGKGPDAVSARIAALIGLVSPPSASVIDNLSLVSQGSIEILPPDGPVTLFVFGARRVLAVRITELSVTEEAHDADLEPLRARVGLGMRVITWADLAQSHPAHALGLANQVARETQARTIQTGSLDGVLGSDVPLI